MICSECGESTATSEFDCHHHSVIEESSFGGQVLVWCEDCPWHVTRERRD